MQIVCKVLEGNPFELPLPDGGQLRAQMSGAEPVDAEVVDGKAVLKAPAKGTHYLAFRSSETDRWQRLGKLVVLALVDERRETLIKEITELDKRITATEAIQYQLTDPGGIAVTRVQLAGLRKQRADAENRLAIYDRRARGQASVRLI